MFWVKLVFQLQYLHGGYLLNVPTAEQSLSELDGMLSMLKSNGNSYMHTCFKSFNVTEPTNYLTFNFN